MHDKEENMGCFIVPAAEAVVTTGVAKAVKSKEKEKEVVTIQTDNRMEEAVAIPNSKKIGWLSKMLWGGSGLLAFEHLWHGEVVPFFPFLTAASTKEDAIAMLHEMSTVGTTMCLVVTGVWALMLVAAKSISKKAIVTDTIKQ